MHRKHDVLKTADVCFVGNLFPGPRADLVSLLQRHFRNTFVGQRYFDDMAKTYSAAHTVFNRSVRNGLSMRVFEALACGSLLVTNDLRDNGQEELFRDGEHLATYAGAEERPTAAGSAPGSDAAAHPNLGTVHLRQAPARGGGLLPAVAALPARQPGDLPPPRPGAGGVRPPARSLGRPQRSRPPVQSSWLGHLAGQFRVNYQLALVALIREGDVTRGIELAEVFARQKDRAPAMYYNLACIYAVAAAAAGSDRRRTEEWAARAMVWLGKAEQAGFFTASALDHARKHEDLDPLRQRADFQELMKRAEKRLQPRDGHPAPP